jgi:hypothetical protein
MDVRSLRRLAVMFMATVFVLAAFVAPSAAATQAGESVTSSLSVRTAAAALPSIRCTYRAATPVRVPTGTLGSLVEGTGSVSCVDAATNRGITVSNITLTTTLLYNVSGIELIADSDTQTGPGPIVTAIGAKSCTNGSYATRVQGTVVFGQNYNPKSSPFFGQTSNVSITC